VYLPTLGYSRDSYEKATNVFGFNVSKIKDTGSGRIDDRALTGMSQANEALVALAKNKKSNLW
jgi:hypothetical protein